MITELQPNEIFVFGSNLAGRHGAGAAKQALKFGAIYGIGEGLFGQTYAFPTLDRKLRKLTLYQMARSRDMLYAHCRTHPELRFLLTKVGCGLAGHPEPMMRSLFCDPPENLILPDGWEVAKPLQLKPPADEELTYACREAMGNKSYAHRLLDSVKENETFASAVRSMVIAAASALDELDRPEVKSMMKKEGIEFNDEEALVEHVLFGILFNAMMYGLYVGMVIVDRRKNG